MAKVQVGIVAFRDEKGNFLPKTKPIYREIPEREAETSHDGMMLGEMQMTETAEQDFYRILAKRVLEYKKRRLGKSGETVV